jgi:predicted esterase
VDGVQPRWTESTEVHQDRAKPCPQCTGAGTGTGAAPRAPVERFAAPGVGELLVAPGDPTSDGVLLYLHGRCGDPEAFQAFVRAIPPSLTLISVRGDVRCKGSSRTKWSVHPAVIDARLQRAVQEVGARRAAPLRSDGWLVMGYSEGALRAEALLTRFPDRYVGGLLAGGPRAPRDGSMSRARRVVLMAGSLDARNHLIAAAEDLSRRGVTARFDLLPGARHGEYGVEAERIVGAALSWVLEGAQPVESAQSFTGEGLPLQH